MAPAKNLNLYWETMSQQSTVQRPNPDAPNQQVQMTNFPRQLQQQIRPDWNFLRQSNRVRKPHLGGSTWSHQQKMQPVYLYSVRSKPLDHLECIQALPWPCQSQDIYSQRRRVWRTENHRGQWSYQTYLNVSWQRRGSIGAFEGTDSRLDEPQATPGKADSCPSNLQPVREASNVTSMWHHWTPPVETPWDKKDPPWRPGHKRDARDQTLVRDSHESKSPPRKQCAAWAGESSFGGSSLVSHECPGVSVEPGQHPYTSWTCKVLTLGWKEAPKIGMLCPQKWT